MTQASFKSTPVLKYLLFKTLLDLHCLIFVKTRQIMDSLKHSLLVPLTYPGLISLALWLCVAFSKFYQGRLLHTNLSLWSHSSRNSINLTNLLKSLFWSQDEGRQSLSAHLWNRFTSFGIHWPLNQLRWSMQDLPVPTLKNHIVSDHLPQLRVYLMLSEL